MNYCVMSKWSFTTVYICVFFPAGILDVIETFPGTEQVLKRFRACRCDNARPPLIVDVIINHGNKWVKVVARKAQAVHLVWAGMRCSQDRIFGGWCYLLDLH